MFFTKNGFVEIRYSAREPEAVRIAAANLKSDLFKVLESRVCLNCVNTRACAGSQRNAGTSQSNYSLQSTSGTQMDRDGGASGARTSRDGDTFGARTGHDGTASGRVRIFGVQNGTCPMPEGLRLPEPFDIKTIVVATGENLPDLFPPENLAFPAENLAADCAVKAPTENCRTSGMASGGSCLTESSSEETCLVDSPASEDSSSDIPDDSETSAAASVSVLIPHRREGYVIAVRNSVLYLCGRDRRGTIYAVYEFCERLGVSPWYFFGDVPPKQRDRFELAEGFSFTDYPSVEYRGIFINDEEELEKWVVGCMAEETIGPKTYAHIFELLLRLKCNYLWPAMHVNSFNANVENGALAEKMGVVIGTSHCDMLMRSNNREWEPWKRKKGYNDLVYDFSIEGENREKLLEYWRESVEQNHDFEVTYTLGMRGIHDSGFNAKALEGLTGDALLKARIALLSDVFRAQEQILKEVPHKEALKIFVPYKEVLPLYDGGLRVPDDYTLIWTNDNYGYVRRYPDEEAKKRRGGHGIYYHQSYWAPPECSYLFVCTIPAAQTRYELSKAYDNGIRRLWVTNFGAIKPLEQQLSFYAALAWNIGKENDPTKDVVSFLADWLDRTFSGGFGNRLAPLLTEFDQVVNMRKLEHMDNHVFYQSEQQDDAAGRIHFLQHVFDEANDIYRQLPRAEQDAFFEMVLMRVHAAYYTNAMYYYADRSQLMAGLGRDSEANRCFDLAENFDTARQALLYYYNHIMANGKWNGIVTPEDFPPPRTAMYPAAVSPKRFGKYLAKAGNRKDMPVFRPLPVSDCTNRITVEACEAAELKTVSKAGTHSASLHDIRIIPHLGRGCGDLVELSDPAATLTYELTLPAAGTYALTIERYPSLNSVGEIGVTVSLDGRAVKHLISDANDEHRGSWKENILNNRDFLNLSLGALTAGRHTITFSEGTKYFAFTRFHVYERNELTNGMNNCQNRWLPGKSGEPTRPAAAPTIRNHFWHGADLNLWLDHTDAPEPADTARIIREFYPGTAIPERPQPVLPPGYSSNSVANEDICWYALPPVSGISSAPAPVPTSDTSSTLTTAAASGRAYNASSALTPVPAPQPLVPARSPSPGCIRIRVADALQQTEQAHTIGTVPDSCIGIGRKEISLYFRSQDEIDYSNASIGYNRARSAIGNCSDTPNGAVCSSQADNSGRQASALAGLSFPGVCYTVGTPAGRYTLWLCLYTKGMDEYCFNVAIDNVTLLPDAESARRLWRYSSENVYKWIPLTDLDLAEGSHTIAFFFHKARLRLEGIVLCSHYFGKM